MQKCIKVLMWLTQGCVYVICLCVCMCVKQRHVSPAKAVVLSGAEGGSEAWKHSWQPADLYWTSSRSDTTSTPCTTKFKHSNRIAEPVTHYNLDMLSLERMLSQKSKWKQYLTVMLLLFQELGVFGRLTSNTEVDFFLSKNVNSCVCFNPVTFQFWKLTWLTLAGGEKEEASKIKRTC